MSSPPALDDDQQLCLQVAQLLAVQRGQSPGEVTIWHMPKHDPSGDGHPGDLIVDVVGKVRAIKHIVVETFETQLQRPDPRWYN